MYHMTTSSHLEFVDKDHAHMEAYWQTVFARCRPECACSRSRWPGGTWMILVRVNGQWLIKTRDVAPKD